MRDPVVGILGVGTCGLFHEKATPSMTMRGCDEGDLGYLVREYNMSNVWVGLLNKESPRTNHCAHVTPGMFACLGGSLHCSMPVALSTNGAPHPRATIALSSATTLTTLEDGEDLTTMVR